MIVSDGMILYLRHRIFGTHFKQVNYHADEHNFLHTRSFQATEPQCWTKVAPLHGKQQSVKTPTQVKALLWYCWWPSKSRAASECIGVVDLEDLIENG